MAERPDCINTCGRKAEISRHTETKTYYKKKCGSCRFTPEQKQARLEWERANRPHGGRGEYRQHKGETCDRCGFVPEHSCQLDVDHIDGDHSNNDPDNLQTLCANCHRLKTKLSKEGIWR